MENNYDTAADSLSKEFEHARQILSCEEYSALIHVTEMTQKLYDSILDKIMLMFPSANTLFFHILSDPLYEKFMIHYAEKHLIEPF